MKVIDCDIHNALPGNEALLPYLKEPWKSIFASRGMNTGGNGYASPVGVYRRDAIPPGGGPQGSDPEFMLRQLFEPYDMEYGILTGTGIMHISTAHDPDYANAVVSAYNDYLIEQWLVKYPKFKGAMIVATQDPLYAAREIDRIGGHLDIVEVIMTSGARAPYGQRMYHPIYEAAVRQGLPVAIHPGSEGSSGLHPPTAAGYPTNYLQWHTCLSQNFMAHTVSLVCDGVFEKYPELKFVFCEGGIAWLPHLMWRLDKNYKGLRSQAPWLKRMPSEYIRNHCYFTTQPIEEPDDPKQLYTLFDMIDAENILLFSSDYPHWDFDDPTQILKRLPVEQKQKIFYDNAKHLYQLRSVPG